jgi:hypothetical protein
MQYNTEFSPQMTLFNHIPRLWASKLLGMLVGTHNEYDDSKFLAKIMIKKM